ncbi:putative diguanylate cyclase YdaM [Halomonas sp. THAF5a]|uniref:sensor domain-containing diguanylate cyclase n=1 Tax=Halomonas sp. THAF5a TaxID=2587844 RepID=UPI0012A96A0E|nr:GGDEF domain-containing protein [Halomonas sp. THAF5a]QFU00740.1 putative diguanylate cyclase YdaM [Halomonas sp. THAF5a]
MGRIKDHWRHWVSSGQQRASLAASLLDGFPGVAMLVNGDGVILYVNPGFERYSGHPAHTMLGRRITCLDVDPLHGDIGRALAHSVTRRAAWRGVLTCRRADGRVTHQQGVFQPLETRSGDPLRLLVTLQDITALHRGAVDDHHRLSALQDTVDRLPGVVFQLRQSVRGDLAFCYLSAGLQALAGLSSRDAMESAETLLARIYDEDRQRLNTSLAQSAVSLAPWSLEFRLAQGDEVRWLEARATPRRQRDGDTLWDGVLLDITARKEEEQRTQTLVRTDMLTGVLNRRAFFDYGEAVRALAARHGRSVPLAMLDIDHFKRLNDTHGHAAGDLALQAFATTCRDCLRPYDLFARIGGEEFAVMLVDTSPEEALGVLDRLRSAVEALELDVQGACLRVTVSLGLAVIPPQGSLDFALSQADAALYRAKREGRNRLIVAPGYPTAPERLR